MAEDLTIVTGTKEDAYRSIIPQINGLLEGETERLNRHWLQGSEAPKAELSLARSG